MATPDQTTLLAFLLALSDLETPLSEDEKSGFKGIAEQLFIGSDDWELIAPDLLSLTNKNSQLQKLFQNYKSHLERLGDIPQPTATHLKIPNSQYQSNPQVRSRGVPPTQNSETKTYEIENIAIRLMTIASIETAKNDPYLQEIKQSLK